VVGFLLGLQYTHTDVDAVRYFSLNPAFIAKWRCTEYVFLLLGMGALTGIVYGSYSYWESTQMVEEFLFLIAIQIAVFTVITLMMQMYDYEIHFHHYTVGMVMQTLLGV
jgi:uncharacterized membrane protein YjfL (UPF0719 family)